MTNPPPHDDITKNISMDFVPFRTTERRRSYFQGAFHNTIQRNSLAETRMPIEFTLSILNIFLDGGFVLLSSLLSPTTDGSGGGRDANIELGLLPR